MDSIKYVQKLSGLLRVLVMVLENPFCIVWYIILHVVRKKFSTEKNTIKKHKFDINVITFCLEDDKSLLVDIRGETTFLN